MQKSQKYSTCQFFITFEKLNFGPKTPEVHFVQKMGLYDILTFCKKSKNLHERFRRKTLAQRVNGQMDKLILFI